MFRPGDLVVFQTGGPLMRVTEQQLRPGYVTVAYWLTNGVQAVAAMSPALLALHRQRPA